MTLIHNTFVFLDTRFFKDYKSKDAAYQKLFEYSKGKKINLCTSHICLEEWRTQKVSQLTKVIQDLTRNLIYLPANNYIAKGLLEADMHNKFPNNEEIENYSKTGIHEFVKENNINVYKPREGHIGQTWEAYFHGNSPFKQVKNKKDIPDAWIFECARDALADELYENIGNKFCIGEDNTLFDALEKLGFEKVTVLGLVEILEKEEAGEIPESETVLIDEREKSEQSTISEEGLSPLDLLLTKSVNAAEREIKLRLLGFIVALDSPSHESLIEVVESQGFDRKLIEACATILSVKPEPYIRDTGSHYIVGNKEICNAAADRLTNEIIEMLGQV